MPAMSNQECKETAATMSNEEHAPRDPRQEPALAGQTGTDGPAVVDPDEVVLDDGDISAEALEPELSVSAEALRLEEPSLEAAQISREIAEAASLEDAAAEARAVAAEAEKAGTLVGGPIPSDAPIVKAAPEGTAPAGGTAGDAGRDARRTTRREAPAASGTTTAPPPQRGSPPSSGSHAAGTTETGETSPRADPSTDDAGDGVTAEATPDADAASGSEVGGLDAPQPDDDEPSSAHPGLAPGTDPGTVGAAGTSPDVPAASPDGGAVAARAPWVPTASGGEQEETDGPAVRDRTRADSSKVPLLLVIGGVVVLLGLLVWLLVTLFGGSDDESRVDPSSLSPGQCLADFSGITEDAVLVECVEPHNAQLVASESYAEDAEFPGRDQLGLRAEAACATASAGIDPGVVTEDLAVTLLRTTPTEGTWADGDRRVDCFAVLGNGDTVSQSLLGP